MPRATQLGEGYRGPSGPTGYLLRQLVHAFHTTQEHGLRPYGLSSPQFGALFVLDHEPGLSSADLARAMGVTPQAANLLVAGMERAGLVRREPHPTHKRVLETYPTDEGARRMRAAKEFIADLEERLMTGLAPDERELIHRWLVTAAEAASQGVSPGLERRREPSSG